jgi:hypothetical protein
MLSKLYVRKPIYYGRRLSRKRCVVDKRRFLRKHPDFRQDIEDLKIIQHTDSSYLVRFKKRVWVSRHSQERDYPAYLRINGDFQIVEEGDKVTDRNLGR